MLKNKNPVNCWKLHSIYGQSAAKLRTGEGSTTIESISNEKNVREEVSRIGSK